MCARDASAASAPCTHRGLPGLCVVVVKWQLDEKGFTGAIPSREELRRSGATGALAQGFDASLGVTLQCRPFDVAAAFAPAASKTLRKLGRAPFNSDDAPHHRSIGLEFFSKILLLSIYS